MVCGKAAVEAGAVTHGAVRCSAWLGDFERRSEWMSLGMQRDELIGSERVQTVCVAGLVHELDLECVARENLDDSANLSSNEPQFGKVADESNSVEQVDVRCGRHIEASDG